MFQRPAGMMLRAALAAGCMGSVLLAVQDRPPAACKPSGAIMRIGALPEASGVAASRVTPGRLWAHNDSGRPEIIALDARAQVAGRVSITGASLEDWEAIASAPCGSGNCLFLADIGDNSARRRDVVVYRVPEPVNASGSAKVDAVLRASYPDGAHDAEALLAAPDGGLYIVTKGDTGHIALYRFPRELKNGGAVRLERVGSPLSKGTPPGNARVTDGAISPDGEWAALRTLDALVFYRASEFLKGDFREVQRTDLKSLREPQGEGVAFGPGNTVYLAGEGGGRSQPGTLAVLSCTR